MCILTTHQGLRMNGKLISENYDKIIVLDIKLGEAAIPRYDIRYFEKINPGSIFEILLKNKSKVKGKIASADKSKWKINTQTMGEVEINFSDISDIYEAGGPNSEIETEKGNLDPARYFVGPSPFVLKKQRAIFHSTDILLNDFSYGVSNNITVTAGLLFIYLPYGDVRYSSQLSRNVHLSIGAMGFGFPVYNGKSALMDGAAYGQIGIGNHENNITCGVFYSYYGSLLRNNNYSAFANNAGFSLAGIKKINDKIFLMGESYFFPFPNVVSQNDSYPNNYTYIIDYVNVGAIGLKIHLNKGILNSNSAVLNIGMCWAAGKYVADNSLVAFPIISYAHIISNKK